MPRFLAHITIMPLKELLDPQGKAVTGALHNLGMDGVEDVRIGRHIHLRLNATSQQEAESMAQDACRKLLANAVMEDFEVSVSPL